jgi:hypothetical protein
VAGNSQKIGAPPTFSTVGKIIQATSVTTCCTGARAAIANASAHVQGVPTSTSTVFLPNGPAASAAMLAIPAYVNVASTLVNVPPPASIDKAICNMQVLLPPVLKPEQSAAAMHKAWQIFGPTPPLQCPLNLIWTPEPYPLDMDFFALNLEWGWDDETPAPHMSLVDCLLAKSAATLLSGAAAPSPLSPAVILSLDTEPLHSAAIFKHVKNAARGHGLVPTQPCSANGTLVLTTAGTLKGKGKSAVKWLHLTINNSDDSVKIMLSNTLKSYACPVKRAQTEKTQIANSIITLTNHIMLEDAKYNGHAKAAAACQTEILQEVVTLLTVVGKGILNILKMLANK